MVAATPFFSDRGCHIRIYNEIKHLQKKGLTVRLCTYHNGQDLPDVQTSRIKKVSWYTKIGPGASWGKPYLDTLLLVKTYKTIKKERPDIIHAHLSEGLLISWIARRFSGSRAVLIFDCQGSLAEEMYDYHLKNHILLRPFYLLFSAIEKILLTLPDTIICSSKKCSTYLKKTYSIKEERVSVVEDGYDEDLFHPLEEGQEGLRKRDALRRHLDIRSDAYVEIYTGSLTSAKGVKNFLDDIPSRLNENDKLVFLIIGYGELEGEYRRKYQTHIEQKKVIFAGRVSYFDLRNLIVVADRAIDPKESLTEGSAKHIHYSACGIPTHGPRMRPLPPAHPGSWNRLVDSITDAYNKIS
jgi:glycosyltransferase involved in cell wall biosynthesis